MMQNRLLRCLLGRSTTIHVSSDVGSVMELSGTTLDAFPDLSSNRGSALSADERVNSGTGLRERVLNVAALSEAGAEERGVQSNQDPRSTLEKDGGEQKTDPEKNLESGYDRHGGVVVLLDKSPNAVGQRAAYRGLAAGRGTSRIGGGLRGREGWDDVGAGIGCDVEDGVDAVGKQSEGVLRREEPDKGHS